MMLYDNFLFGTNLTGYIAGTGDGIVTAGALPAVRDVILFNMDNLSVIYRSQSLKNGHYLFMGLDTNQRYLVMVRDLPPQGAEQGYEPYCYDYVIPANDLTVAEQKQIWEEWNGGA